MLGLSSISDVQNAISPLPIISCTNAMLYGGQISGGVIVPPIALFDDKGQVCTIPVLVLPQENGDSPIRGHCHPLLFQFFYNAL